MQNPKIFPHFDRLSFKSTRKCQANKMGTEFKSLIWIFFLTLLAVKDSLIQSNFPLGEFKAN